MKTTTAVPIAQLAENFLQRTALGVLLMALAYALAAAIYLVNDTLAQPMEWVKSGLSVGAALIVLPGFVRMLRLRMHWDCDLAEAESYIGGVFRTACVAGFCAAFVLMTLSGPLAERMPTQLPMDFYLQSILALSLGAFGVSFFAALWRDRDGEPDDFEHDAVEKGDFEGED
jgi:hypothetical protein